MSPPLLQTKLNVPQPRPEAVDRPRLLAALEEGLHGALTVVAAPAGYGKTTLLAQWLATLERPVGWLSLDSGDDDLQRFFSYVAAALRATVGDSGRLHAALADEARPRPLATAFLHDVAQAGEPFVLVLDDYHLLQAAVVHEAIAFMVEHAPPGMHLVLSGRSRPPLPLARLQVSGQLTVLGAGDLRLTTAEAVAFLQQTMTLELGEEQATALAARCEGWVAGLQLAALALRQQQPAAEARAGEVVDDFVDRFGDRFGGPPHQIAEYLVEEVLAQQPASTRAFLRQTAILERFNGDLCNAVTGREDGHQILARLLRDNLFLVPLDLEQVWFRYHHLFAGVLRRRFHERGNASPAALHARACDWLDAHGLREEAMHHALAAGDQERAAALVVKHGEALWTRNRPGTLLQWLEALPAPLRAQRPYLGLLYAWALWFGGRWSEVAGALGAARQALERAPATEGAPPLPLLQGMAALLQGNLAMLRGEPAVAVRRAEEAASLIPPGDHAWACMVAQCRGDGERLLGDMSAAAAAYEDALHNGQAAGNVYAALTAARYLGEIQYAQGQLHQATATFRRALALAVEMKAERLPATANIRIRYSKLLLDWFELDAAQAELEAALDISEGVAYGLGLITGYVELARVHQLRGDSEQARELLQLAYGVATRQGHAQLRRHIAAVRAEFHLTGDGAGAAGVAQTRFDERGLAAASYWAREQRLTPQTEWTTVTLPALTYAAVLLAEGRPEAAQSVLRRLYRLASQAGRRVEQVQVRVLQVRAATALGEGARAAALLQEALALAEPETIVRPFVAGAAALLPLLQRLQTGDLPDLPEVVAAFAARVERTAAGLLLRRQVGREAPAGEARAQAPSQPSLPQFTAREWDVLRLLGRGFTNRQIADALVVAESTVKTHLNHVYRKLDVSSRTEALARLQDVLLA